MDWLSPRFRGNQKAGSGFRSMWQSILIMKMATRKFDKNVLGQLICTSDIVQDRNNWTRLQKVAEFLVNEQCKFSWETWFQLVFKDVDTNTYYDVVYTSQACRYPEDLIFINVDEQGMVECEQVVPVRVYKTEYQPID